MLLRGERIPETDRDGRTVRPVEHHPVRGTAQVGPCLDRGLPVEDEGPHPDDVVDIIGMADVGDQIEHRPAEEHRPGRIGGHELDADVLGLVEQRPDLVAQHRQLDRCAPRPVAVVAVGLAATGTVRALGDGPHHAQMGTQETLTQVGDAIPGQVALDPPSPLPRLHRLQLDVVADPPILDRHRLTPRRTGRFIDSPGEFLQARTP